MSKTPMWRRYLRFFGPDVESDVDDELRFHLEMRTQEYIGRGMDRPRAREEALQRFGDVERVRRACRQEGRRVERVRRRREMLASISRDLRHAARALLRAPVFTLTVVVTLALGIGATAAIFTLVNGVLLQPLPYPEPDRLVAVGHTLPGADVTETGQSAGTYRHYLEHSRAIEEMGVYNENFVTLTGRDEPERIRVAMVTPTIPSMLGVAPHLGRLFTAEDAAPDAEVVVMISHDLWVRRYGADPEIIGGTIEVNLGQREVVGVMPRGFDFPSRETQVWYGIGAVGSRASVRDLYMTGIARLRAGVSPHDAEADLNRLIPSLADAYPDATPELLESTGLAAVVKPLKWERVGDIAATLWILLGGVGFVLLIACANVGNLFLVRAEHRHKEITVRSALGARRADVARYFLSESLLLTLLGGLLGLLLAYAGVRSLIAFGPENIPRLDEVAIDGWLLAFTAAITILTGLLFGAVPLLRHGRPDLTASLKEGAGATAGRTRQRLRRLLVASQVALALVLLIGSALMVQSLRQLQRVDLGFDPENILTFELPLSFRQAPTIPAAATFYVSVVEKLRTTPGVTAAEAVWDLPLTPAEFVNRPFTAGGSPADTREVPPAADISFATPGYFEAMRIPLLGGRAFEEGDLLGEAPPVILNAAFARTLFRGEDPIGRSVQRADRTDYPAYIVVGLAGDVPGETMTDGPAATVYFPLIDDLRGETENPPIGFIPAGMSIVVRTTMPSSSLMPTVRRIVGDINPQVPIVNVRAMEQIVSDAMAQTSFTMLLLVITAVVALFLGAVGIYGVISYAVSRRTTELGVRIALGALPADVVRMVVRQGALLALAGIAAGLLAAFALTRYLDSLLYEVSPSDPAAFAAMAALLFVIALAASYLPARRAGRIDPTRALKGE